MKTIQDERDPLFSKAIRSLRLHKQDLQSERPEHICSKAFCNPQNEENTCPGPHLTSNVYLCKFGSIHVCSESSCEHYGHSPTQTCHISGFQFGQILQSYDKNDSRTYGSKRELDMTGNQKELDLLLGEDGVVITKPSSAASAAGAPRPKKHHYYKKMPLEEVKEQAGELVKLLLYSKCRTACNKAALKRYHNEAADSVATYNKQQLKAGQQPFASDIYRLHAFYSSRELPLVEFKFDPVKHEYYTSVIVQVWEKVMKYYVPKEERKYEEDGTVIPPRINFQSVGLGVLYAMRQGLHHGDVELLAQDSFLERHLPQGSDLATYFNLSRKLITSGDGILARTFENAFRANAPITELTIKATEIGTNNSAPSKRGRKKKTEKIGHSGELLFMPQSRKQKK